VVSADRMSSAFDRGSLLRVHSLRYFARSASSMLLESTKNTMDLAPFKPTQTQIYHGSVLLPFSCSILDRP
jgi:hypothetical protein